MPKIELDLRDNSEFKSLQFTRPFFRPTSTTSSSFKPQISPFAKMVLDSSEIAYRCKTSIPKRGLETLLTRCRPYPRHTQSKSLWSSSFPSHPRLVKIARAVYYFPKPQGIPTTQLYSTREAEAENIDRDPSSSSVRVRGSP